MSRFRLFAFTLLAVAVAGCSRDVPLAPLGDSPDGDSKQVVKIPQVDRTVLDQMIQLAMTPDGGISVIGKGRKMVEVPDGSADALAAAIAQAGANGMVLLKAGTHTESARIEVAHAINIIGEDGAEIVSSVGGLATTDPAVAQPVLDILASHVTVQNVTFRPASGDGNTAILVRGGDHTTLFRNRMTGYQFGIVVARGDHSRIWKNTVVTNGAWLTGGVGGAFGITLVNGSHASVLENDVSNSLFGIWACGDLGELAFNKASGNFIGVILCTVPANSFELPDGSLSGADLSCQNWVCVQNSTTANYDTGFLVIDNANNNTIADNASSGNGGYDVELTGDTYRFGFLTPASHDNLFIAGSYPNIEVKDCGNNNQIVGGALVDNTVEPCN